MQGSELGVEGGGGTGCDSFSFPHVRVCLRSERMLEHCIITKPVSVEWIILNYNQKCMVLNYKQT